MQTNMLFLCWVSLGMSRVLERGRTCEHVLPRSCHFLVQRKHQGLYGSYFCWNPKVWNHDEFSNLPFGVLLSTKVAPKDTPIDP